MFGWKRLVDDCGKATVTFNTNKDQGVSDLTNGFLRYGCTNLLMGFAIGCVGPVVVDRIERCISKKIKEKKIKELDDKELKDTDK
jgi:dihydroorotate dehydrogenase